MTEENESVCEWCGSRNVFYDALDRDEPHGDPEYTMVLKSCGGCGHSLEFKSPLPASHFDAKSYVPPKITRPHENLEEALEELEEFSSDAGIGPMPIEEQEREAEEELSPGMQALHEWEREAVSVSMMLADWSESLRADLERSFRVHGGSLSKTIGNLRDFIEREFDYSGGRMSTYKNRAVKAEAQAKSVRELAAQYKAELVQMKQERDLLAGELGPRDGLLVSTAGGGVRLATDDELEQIKTVRALMSKDEEPPSFSEIKVRLERSPESAALATLERLARLASTWDPDYITYEIDRESGELLCLDVIEPSIPPADGLNPINNMVLDLRRLEEWAAHHSGSRGVDHQVEWLQGVVEERALFREECAKMGVANERLRCQLDDCRKCLVELQADLSSVRGSFLQPLSDSEMLHMVGELAEQQRNLASSLDVPTSDFYERAYGRLAAALESGVVRAVEDVIQRREVVSVPHEIRIKVRAGSRDESGAVAEELAHRLEESIHSSGKAMGFNVTDADSQFEMARRAAAESERESVEEEVLGRVPTGPHVSSGMRQSLESMAVLGEDQPIHAVERESEPSRPAYDVAAYHMQTWHPVADYTADRIAERITRHMELGGNASLLGPGRAKWVASHILRAMDEIQEVQVRRLVDRSERAASWRNMDPADAAERLHRIVTAIRVEVDSSNPCNWELRKLFADVANFAMFGFDVVTNGRAFP